MLDYIIQKNKGYIENMPKEIRKKYGQFFTNAETARFMASLFDLPQKREVTILDPGAGSGILSAALLERIEKSTEIETIRLICYETDKNILPLLQDNLHYLAEHCQKQMTYDIKMSNYITSQEFDFNDSLFPESSVSVDLCIGNPPYLKIGRQAPEALAMKKICYGAPNLYFLFAAMSLCNLKDEGQMVYIIPRSWTSGAYFKRFREYLFQHGVLEYVHLFASRNKVFTMEQVLQETIIIKIRKTQSPPRYVTVSSSESSQDFRHLQVLQVPYPNVVSSAEYYVYLMTTYQEAEVVASLQKFPYTLPDLGLKMRTGLTVDFRERDLLRSEPEKGTVPLFFPQHIKDGKISFPLGKENEYILAEKTSLLQPNRNYLFIKRFTAKEEPRRLQCGIYLAQEFPQYKQISTQNKINFIDSLNHDLSVPIVYGLYVLFNSSFYDQYYRVLNGSTQVNSTEINHLPVPALQVIEQIGEQLLKQDVLTTEACDEILEEQLNEQGRRSQRVS